jgi:hypothetical protein
VLQIFELVMQVADAPAAAIASSSTERPDILSTSWRK